MYYLRDIKEILIDAGISHKIFLYSSPAESAGRCIILQPSYDPVPIDHELFGYRKGRLQTIIRDFDDEEGILLSQELSNYLTLFNLECINIIIKRMLPLHEVRRYRRSDSGAVEFSINYEIIFTNK